MKQWLRTSEMSKETGYTPTTLTNMALKKEFPEDKIKKKSNGTWRYHCSLIPILIAKRQIWTDFHYDGMGLPPDAIEYDGYHLTPEEIRILEAIRSKKGYRTQHYTTLSITELIAMGGDKQNNHDYY